MKWNLALCEQTKNPLGSFMLAQFNSSLFILLMEIRSPKGITDPWYQSFPLWYFSALHAQDETGSYTYLWFDSEPESRKIYKIINWKKTKHTNNGILANWRFLTRTSWYQILENRLFYDVIMLIDFNCTSCRGIYTLVDCTLTMIIIFFKKNCLLTTLYSSI